MNVISQPYLKSPLTHWQAAINGEWETAKTLPANADITRVQDFVRWIENAPQDIAIEAFFKNQDDSLFFYGLRLKTLSKQSQIEFIQAIISNTSTDTLYEHVVAKTCAQLNVAHIMTQIPDFLEVGIEGAWKTSGFMRVWNVGTKSAASVPQINKEAPHLLGSFSRAVMMEAAWHEPMPMWFALPISDLKNGKHHFSEQKYNAISSAWIKREPL